MFVIRSHSTLIDFISGESYGGRIIPVFIVLVLCFPLSLTFSSQHSAIDWIFRFHFIFFLGVHCTAYSKDNRRILVLAQRLQLRSIHDNADRVSLLYFIYTKIYLKVSVFLFFFFSFLDFIWLVKSRSWAGRKISNVEPKPTS